MVPAIRYLFFTLKISETRNKKVDLFNLQIWATINTFYSSET